MRHNKTTILMAILTLAMAGCAGSAQRKSSSYYQEHKSGIQQILTTYEGLYNQKPFSAGFSDKSFQYFLMEVQSDSVRYIYNSEKNTESLKATVIKYHYDTAKLASLAKQLKAIECLWISKSSFFVNENRETVTFLSFKSVSSNKAFSENKYYVLIFTPHELLSERVKKKLASGELVKIDDRVYFTIGSNFR